MTNTEPTTTPTYATLDEAEAGQPRASVERLADMARYPGQTADMSRSHVQALVRDHARIVLARLDELDRDAGARRIADLERALTSREDQVVGYQLSLGRANARIAELEAENLRLREQSGEMAARIAELEAQLQDVGQTSADAMLALADQAGYPPVSPPVNEQPAQVRKVLGELGVDVPSAIGGTDVLVREHTRTGTGRAIGHLDAGTALGLPDRLRTDDGRGAPVVATELIPAYVEAVRVAGTPGPTKRRLLLAQLIRAGVRVETDEAARG